MCSLQRNTVANTMFTMRFTMLMYIYFFVVIISLT